MAKLYEIARVTKASVIGRAILQSCGWIYLVEKGRIVRSIRRRGTTKRKALDE